jgi:hypothetical protein
MSTWLNAEQFMDDPSEWAVISANGKPPEVQTLNAVEELDRRRAEKRARELQEHGQ